MSKPERVEGGISPGTTVDGAPAPSSPAQPTKALAAERAELVNSQTGVADLLDRLLDDALSDTFPASDPIAIVLPRPRPTI
jgi:hypothetical protein